MADNPNAYPNSGRMFKNAKKQTDKHPDGDGEGEIDAHYACEKCGHTGISKARFWINGWRKAKDKNGDPWWSFAFKQKMAQKAQSDDWQKPKAPEHLGLDGGRVKPAHKDRIIDEEIPF